MAVTIVDIAKRVGVTPTTVSKVLNRRKKDVRISDATRKKVMDAVRELNYRPSFSARALRNGRTYSLGFLCGDIESPHFSELTSIALKKTQKCGYHLLLSLTEWDYQKELDCMDLLLQRGVDGIIANTEALQPGVPLVEEMREQKFPIVALTAKHSVFPSVASDWSEGMQQAVSHLRQKGHSRIGYVSWDKYRDESPDGKLTSLKKACTEQGVELESYLVSNVPEEHRRFGEEIASQKDRPSAFVMYSDYVAMNYAAGLLGAGMRIPEDIAIVGIDGTEASSRVFPPITTIAQDMHQIIDVSMGLILKMLDGEDVPAEVHRIPTRLMIRKSV